MKKSPVLLTKAQIRLLTNLCQETIEAGDPRSGFLVDIVKTLKTKTPWEMSRAASWLEYMLYLHQNAPGSQEYEDFREDHLIYIIARIADAIKKYPPEGWDGRWTTMVRMVKEQFGVQLNMGHALAKIPK